MTTRSSKTVAWSDTFRNILELERANGFNDKAVIGGMDGFVRLWAEAMTPYVGKSPDNRRLIRPGYSGMATEERAAWATQWLSILDGGQPAPETDAGTESTKEEPKPPAGRARKASPTKKPAASKSGPVGLDSPVTDLRRVSGKLTDQLERLEIATVRDLIYHFPNRHIDYSKKAKISELWPGQDVTVVGEIAESRELSLGRRRLRATEATLADDTGSVRVTWFGQGYLSRSLKAGTQVAVSGKVDAFNNRLVFESPEYDVLRSRQAGINTGRLVPVYPLTGGLTGRNLRNLTWQVLKERLDGIEETLPDAVRSGSRLLPLKQAIQEAHYPQDAESCDRARRRLAFDELLTLQLSVLARRQREVGLLEGPGIEAPAQFVASLLSSLPFELTGAQRRCLDEILEDMRRGTPPMNRLLQGEVGSGKTVVVLIAILVAIAGGYQGAIMVPTEVLAEQHFQTVTRLLGGMADITQAENLLTVYLEPLGRPMTVGLLTGSTRARPRNRLRALAAEGSLDLLIGTHALIQDGVEMPRLALAVMDEQHRFGVLQRLALRQRSAENPPYAGNVGHAHSPHPDPDAVRRPGHFRR